jgi:hypothetical protein
VDVYEAWQRPDDAAEWRKRTEPESETPAP